jgi:hypothetical protein
MMETRGSSEDMTMRGSVAEWTWREDGKYRYFGTGRREIDVLGFVRFRP